LREILGRVAHSEVHPGLLLDKYLEPACDQEQQKQRLKRVVESAGGDRHLFAEFKQRRDAMLEALKVRTWSRTTCGPLTLHLARASALENAGVCLHSTHGFVYLPGTGLKGLARAFAETVWKPSQSDRGQAQTDIERVFGRIAQGKQTTSEAGAVVFHDAWPEQWPRLTVDIVNNHHPEYYRRQGNDAPPGDWEKPSMVYFLAALPGQTFSFALGARREGDVETERRLELARAWLDGGLTHLGCGAKTAAGYGRFQPPDAQLALLVAPRFASLSARLTLTTPAFLAGADQTSGAECDLRPATLRGLLRWWWRTLHAGYVDVQSLRKLEAELWGNTRIGSAAQLAVVQHVHGTVLEYNYRDPRQRFAPAPDFRTAHGLARRPNNKTTQGLFYASYGMDDKGDAGRRHHLDPGAAWTVRILVRNDRHPNDELALNQFRAALWLLCHYGAVGSKSRKGFGSLTQDQDDPTFDLARYEAIAEEFRHSLGLTSRFRPDWAESPTLGQRRGPIEVRTRWTDPWFAMDQVGYAYQAFAQAHRHDGSKLALGLPRKIHGPLDSPMRGQVSHRRPVPLRAPGGEDRFASPVHIHLDRSTQGGLIIRALAFPSRRLPDLAQSTRVLQEFLDHFQREIEERSQSVTHPTGGPDPRGPSTRHQAPRSPGSSVPKSNQRVQVRLLPEKTKKGGWLAVHEPSGLSGPIQDPKGILKDKQPRDEVPVIVASVDVINKKIQFKLE
jgi:CRISPR-associated protein Cmr6